jgi:hypothetical protein
MQFRTGFSAMSVWSFRRTAIATCVLLLAAATSAVAAEYRDPEQVFAFTYDDKLWSLDIDASGEFGVECKPDACQGAVAGCSLSKEKVPLGSAERIMKTFDGIEVAREQIAAFAEQKAELERTVASAVSWDRDADVQPELLQPYRPWSTSRHPVQRAEFRMSMAGQTARYVSYMTAAGSYSVAMVCHATEAQIETWQPRFDALMAAFQAAPRTKKAQ